MRIEHGWLVGSGIRHCPSSNFDSRKGTDVSLLVIHNISLPPGEFGGCHIDQLFTNSLDTTAHPFFGTIAELRVSAHVLIDREGKVTQYVSFEDRAWHAGKSWFQGRDNCNDFSIGIELEGTDDMPYTEEQYRTLAAITRELLNLYPRLNRDTIVGHCDIAPDRKTDPGKSFDWERYFALLKNSAACVMTGNG